MLLMNIGVMGAHGSFSEQAGEMYIATNALVDATIVPLVTAEAVLASLSDGSIDKAVFPVMNSTGGIVIEAMHAMGKYAFSIETMFEMDVHHMLLVKEGTTSNEVTTITSHDQALKQCRQYLERVWPQAEVIPYIDTAKAAADVASGVLLPSTAVIAARRSADFYNLKILEASIQDSSTNKTTFVVAKRSEI